MFIFSNRPDLTFGSRVDRMIQGWHVTIRKRGHNVLHGFLYFINKYLAKFSILTYFTLIRPPRVKCDPIIDFLHLAQLRCNTV